MQCKQAHIKCNEEGPPCGRCKLRATPCEYAGPGAASSVEQQGSPSVDGPPHPAVTNGDVQLQGPPFPTNDRRLLELQLMHRWTTVTYKSMCSSIAQDHEVWREKLPVWSLDYDFLLSGLLSLTAFEAASCSSGSCREQYVTAAVEYQAAALGEFRQHLGKGTQVDNYEPILCFALLLMVLALASSQFTTDTRSSDNGSNNVTSDATENMVQYTITVYELIRGCVTVLGDTGAQTIASNPYIQRLTRFEDLPRTPFDSATQDALANLHEMNERRLTCTVSEPYEARVRHVAHFEACKKAISLLQECFAKCVFVDNDYQGYVLGWLNMAGDEYVQAIKLDDSVAMLVLLVLGRLGREVE